MELGLWSEVNHLYQLYPRIHRFGENLCYPIISHYLNPLPVLWWGPCSSFLLFCVCVLLCVITLWVPCCDVPYDFSMKRMFGSSLPPVVWRWSHVLFTLFVLCLPIVVSNTYCVVFFFVLCILYCQFLWIFLIWLPLRYYLVFIFKMILFSRMFFWIHIFYLLKQITYVFILKTKRN